MNFYFLNPWLWGAYMNTNIMIYLMIAMIVPMIAQGYLTSIMNTYKNKGNSTNLTGYDVARRMLDANGLRHVQVEETNSRLSNHYDLRAKAVRLSPEVYHKPSVAAVAIAAHEVGHALQHAQNYGPLNLQGALMPTARIASRFSYAIIVIGLLLQMFVVAQIGMIMIAAVFIFQLVALPVEFNASARALTQLNEMNILYDHQEKRGIRKVLTAAALTYLAALIVALMEFLRWAAILNGRGRRR